MDTFSGETKRRNNSILHAIGDASRPSDGEVVILSACGFDMRADEDDVKAGCDIEDFIQLSRGSAAHLLCPRCAESLGL